MANCPGDATLALVLEGTLPPAQRGAVVAHLDTCAGCRALLADAIATGARAISRGAPGTGPAGAEAQPATLASAFPDLPASGATIAGRYLLGAPLGRGGMGVVYEAVQLDLARTVAVKLLPPSADPTAAARFAREARTLAQLAHPSIVQIFDYGTDGSVAFVVMERLPGRNLAEAIRVEGRLEVGRSVQIASEMLIALSVAHASMIVHRDIKPGNVFLVAGAPERVKLLDFGIAATDDGSPRLTETGTRVGTPAYMAPEQILAGTLDPRTDLHAVGACLFEMLAGRRAFSAPTSAEIIAQIVRGGAPRVDSVRHDVPTRLADVVDRAMARDPSARFASAEAMLEALAPWRTGVAPMVAPASIHSAPMTSGPPVSSPTRPIQPSAMVQPTAMHAMHAMPPAPAAQSNSRLWIILLASVLVTVVAGVVVGGVAFLKLSAPTQGPIATPSFSATSLPGTSSGATGASSGASSAVPVAGTNRTTAPPKEQRVPCVCQTSDGFALCSQKVTTCECQTSDGFILFARPQTQDSKDGSTVDAPGKSNGDACSGFTKGTSKEGVPISKPGTGSFRACNDCSVQKAIAHPTLAAPGTPCRGNPQTGFTTATGTWKPVKP